MFQAFLFLQISRMNAEFEEKLLELKRELEAQRLQQVGTMKNVLERHHSKDILELDDIHQQQMDGLRDGKCYLSEPRENIPWSNLIVWIIEV